ITTAAVPSSMLDEEQLTLLAAPRSSLERTVAFLNDLSRDFGGTAFWGLIEGERLYCLQTVLASRDLHPGFDSGAGLGFDETRIGAALRARGAGFVAEADGSRATLLVEALSHRGHALGWIGLSVPPRTALPDAASVAGRIREFFATPLGDGEAMHARAAG
ncbi:MAG: ribose transport system ATP-binding protein, partial [Rhodospirillaceae bacterium]|nr:ribose transport system ATP-binding protein [Rhodospirillaceae bacterium]